MSSLGPWPDSPMSLPAERQARQPDEGETVATRRLMGIDLGIAGDHTVRCSMKQVETVAKRRCAVFFVRWGHLVFRMSSAKASDLRKSFSRHTETVISPTTSPPRSVSCVPSPASSLSARRP